MTNNKQQTAVDSIIEFCQKQMDNDSSIHSYNQSWHFRDKPYETAEKYYNETYGGGEQ